MLQSRSSRWVPPTGTTAGLAVLAAGAAAAMLAHAAVSSIGTLTWAILLGVLAANTGLLPRAASADVRASTKRMLRVGVALLGFSLSLTAVAHLGGPVLLLVVGAVTTTLIGTYGLSRMMKLGHAQSLLLATGTAICGASAIAAMEENAGADEDDVATAIAMITLWGSVAMLALPLLRHPLGLDDTQFGAWAGASIHEVGQVVAAAGTAGGAALSMAVLVKLTRVMMLAPVVAGVNVLRRRSDRRSDTTRSSPPILPAFVVAFIVCVIVRSTGLVPPGLLEAIAWVQTALLAAAMFGMGTGVDLRSLIGRGAVSMTASFIGSVGLAAVTLAGVLVLV